MENYTIVFDYPLLIFHNGTFTDKSMEIINSINTKIPGFKDDILLKSKNYHGINNNALGLPTFWQYDEWLSSSCGQKYMLLVTHEGSLCETNNLAKINDDITYWRSKDPSLSLAIEKYLHDRPSLLSEKKNRRVKLTNGTYTFDENVMTYTGSNHIFYTIGDEAKRMYVF